MHKYVIRVFKDGTSIFPLLPSYESQSKALASRMGAYRAKGEVQDDTRVEVLDETMEEYNARKDMR